MSDLEEPPLSAVYNPADRDKFIRLVRLLARRDDSFHVSHTHERNYSCYRMRVGSDGPSVHVTFDESVARTYVTRIVRPGDTSGRPEWLRGDIDAWIETLGIDRDDVLAILLDRL